MGMPTEAGKHDERELRDGTSAAAVTVVPERAGEVARPARGGWFCLLDRANLLAGSAANARRREQRKNFCLSPINAHIMRIDAGAIPLGHDRAASKRPVNMTLNEDLVRRARGITPNLSETVERLLAAFVDDAEAQAARHEQQIAAHIAASDAFVAKHGTLADEFDSL